MRVTTGDSSTGLTVSSALISAVCEIKHLQPPLLRYPEYVNLFHPGNSYPSIGVWSGVSFRVWFGLLYLLRYQLCLASLLYLLLLSLAHNRQLIQRIQASTDAKTWSSRRALSTCMQAGCHLRAKIFSSYLVYKAAAPTTIKHPSSNHRPGVPDSATPPDLLPELLPEALPKLVSLAFVTLPVYGTALTPVPFVQVPGWAVDEKVISAHWNHGQWHPLPAIEQPSSPYAMYNVTHDMRILNSPKRNEQRGGRKGDTHVIQPSTRVTIRNDLDCRVHTIGNIPWSHSWRPDISQAEFPNALLLDCR